MDKDRWGARSRKAVRAYPCCSLGSLERQAADDPDRSELHLQVLAGHGEASAMRPRRLPPKLDEAALIAVERAAFDPSGLDPVDPLLGSHPLEDPSPDCKFVGPPAVPRALHAGRRYPRDVFSEEPAYRDPGACQEDAWAHIEHSGSRGSGSLLLEFRLAFETVVGPHDEDGDHSRVQRDYGLVDNGVEILANDMDVT